VSCCPGIRHACLRIPQYHTSIISERRTGGSRMSPSARLSKDLVEWLHTYHVETAAVENLDDFRFRAPVTALRTAEYSHRFCDMMRVKQRTHRRRSWKLSRLCTVDTWFERCGCRPMLGGTCWDSLCPCGWACMYECARMYRFFQGMHEWQMLRRRGVWRVLTIF